MFGREGEREERERGKRERMRERERDSKGKNIISNIYIYIYHTPSLSFSLSVSTVGLTRTCNLRMMRQVFYHCATISGLLVILFSFSYKLHWLDMNPCPWDDEASVLLLCYFFWPTIRIV
jgi:hypothetical protein